MGAPQGAGVGWTGLCRLEKDVEALEDKQQ